MRSQAMGLPDLHLHFEVKTASGIVMHRHDEEAHSWVRNAWVAWNAIMMDSGGSGDGSVGPGKLSVRDYASNTTRSRSTSTFGRWITFSGYGFYNTGTTTGSGIIVGRGDDPFLSDDYMLYDLIPSGNDPGRLAYQGQDAPVLSYDETTKKWTTTITRVLNNNSGSEIVVKEIGLRYIGRENLDGDPLMARDVLANPVSVPNGAQLTVTYTLTSISFGPCEEKALTYPELGTPGSGGFFAGNNPNWPHPNHDHYLIISPIEGQLATADLLTDAGFDQIGGTLVRDEFRSSIGKTGSDLLVSLGVESPIGEKLAAFRASSSFNDWYIPADPEIRHLYNSQGLMPTGHEFVDEDHWSMTTPMSWSNRLTVRNPITNSSTPHGYYFQSYPARCIRRIHHSEWVPDTV